MNKFGFTLIETVVAVFILGVGVLAVFGLQASSLTSTRNATILQELNDLARSEVELQREFSRFTDAPVNGETCAVTTEPTGFACTVNVFPCQYAVGTDTLTCSNTTIIDAPAHQIVVTVTAPAGRSFTLSSVVKTKPLTVGP